MLRSGPKNEKHPENRPWFSGCKITPFSWGRSYTPSLPYEKKYGILLKSSLTFTYQLGFRKCEDTHGGYDSNVKDTLIRFDKCKGTHLFPVIHNNPIFFVTR